MLKLAVQVTIRIKSRDVSMAYAVNGGETAANEDPAVAMDGDRPDNGEPTTYARKPVLKASVNLAIRVKPYNSAATHTVDGLKLASDQHLAVRLHGNGVDRCVRFGEIRRFKAPVQTAVGSEPRNTGSKSKDPEVAPDYYPSVILQGNRTDASQ